MKTVRMTLLSTLLILFGGASLSAANTEALPIGIVNFKVAVEKSKQGQQEKNAYDGLKKQMTSMLEKTDKELDDVAKKLEDQEYMDGLSPTAEEELKQKFQSLSQDFARYQNQYYQMLNQANYKLLQGLNLYVSKAAENVAKNKNLAFIFNEDSVFFALPAYDVTQDVIHEMDRRFEDEHKSKTETADAADSK